MLWNTLKEKHSRTLVNFADEEQKRIAAELSKMTLQDKVRQEKATADRMEADARAAILKELEGRIAFVDKLRELRLIPLWDARGNMMFVKAPPNYDWDGLAGEMLKNRDLDILEPGRKDDPSIR